MTYKTPKPSQCFVPAVLREQTQLVLYFSGNIEIIFVIKEEVKSVSVRSKVVPHGGVLVRGEQAVAGLHASNSHCPLSWLAGHKHWLLV